MASVPLDPRQMARIGIHSEQQAQRRFDRMVLRKWEQRRRALAEAQDPDIILSDARAQLALLCGVSLKEQNLSDALQEYCARMAFDVFQGREVTYDDTYEAINRIAEEHGFLSGVPVPLGGAEQPDLVMAEGVPLAELFKMNQEHRRRVQRETEMGEELRLNQIPVRNSWHVLGDHTVCVIETEQGPMTMRRWDAGSRLRKLIRGNEVRHHAHQTAAAEMKALASLEKRISPAQFNSYVLSGILPERSKRSDIWYFFRKGYPTLAVSFHGKQYGDQGKVLCALCLHPMGYYSGTHVGLMTPTDEVIAHLLMMRADERKFWAKSGQWNAEDTRSGI
jgi:hypothetical protein